MDAHWPPETSSAGTAFEHVAVLPMSTDRILPDQTVVVRDGRISWLGPAAEARIGRGVQRLDGRGKYLMPGLADMHTHPVNERQLLLYVAHGVTTIRNMWGMPRHLLWRRRIEAGELVGPQIYTTGHYLDGCPHKLTWIYPVTTKDEAITAVRATKLDGYDAVKIDDQLSADAYGWVIQAAEDYDIPVCGHVPFRVGLSRSLASSQVSFEHLHGYLEAGLPRAQQPTGPAEARDMVLQELARTPEDRFVERIAEAAEATLAADTWNCPTLVVRKHWTQTRAQLVNSPETRFESVLQIHRRRCWADLLSSTAVTQSGAKLWQLYLATTKQLHDAGAGLLTGADSGHPTSPPGTSLHRELQTFVEAGLTPYQALRAATTNPARFLGVPGEWGVVEVGARADLVLVDANPLDDIANAARISGVMSAGRWVPASTFDEVLQRDVNHQNGSPAARRANRPTHRPAAEARRSAEYRMSWDGIPVGLERVALTEQPDGGVVLHSEADIEQLVTELCLPGSEAGTYDVEITADPQGRELTAIFACDTADGRQRLLLSRDVDAIRIEKDGIDHRQGDVGDAGPDAMLAMPLTLLWVQAAQRGQRLDVGERTTIEVQGPGLPPDFVVRRSDLEITREPESQPGVRRYECRLSRANMTVHATLTADPDGLPIEVAVYAGAAMSRVIRESAFPTVLRRA